MELTQENKYNTKLKPNRYANYTSCFEQGN